MVRAVRVFGNEGSWGLPDLFFSHRGSHGWVDSSWHWAGLWVLSHLQWHQCLMCRYLWNGHGIGVCSMGMHGETVPLGFRGTSAQARCPHLSIGNGVSGAGTYGVTTWSWGMEHECAQIYSSSSFWDTGTPSSAMAPVPRCRHFWSQGMESGYAWSYHSSRGWDMGTTAVVVALVSLVWALVEKLWNQGLEHKCVWESEHVSGARI